MLKPSKQLAFLALGTMLALPGCGRRSEADQRKADRAVEEKLADARDVIESDTPGGKDTAMKDLTEAASNHTASTAVQIQAVGDLAASELNDGCEAMVNLDDDLVATNQKLWYITVVGEQINDINAAVDRYRELEPKGPISANDEKRKQVADELAKINDNADQPAGIAQLEAGIRGLQQKMADQRKQIGDMYEDADKVYQRSLDEHGQKSVDLFNQATAEREQAGKIATDVESERIQIVHLQRDLGSQLVQKKDREEALAALDDEKNKLNDTWSANSDQIKQQQDSAKTLAEQRLAVFSERQDKPEKGSTPSLAEILDNAKDQRQRAEKSLTAAIEHFGEATELAHKLNDQIHALLTDEHYQRVPEREAWMKLLDLYNVNYYLKNKGAAEHALAVVHAEQLLEMQIRKYYYDELSPIFDKAQLTVPKTVEFKDMDKAIDDLAAKATKEYTDAIADLEHVAGGTLPTTEPIREAKVEHVFAMFDRYLVASHPVDLRAVQQAVEAMPKGSLPDYLPDEIAGPRTIIQIRQQAEGGALAMRGEDLDAQKAMLEFYEDVAKGDVDTARSLAVATDEQMAPLETLSKLALEADRLKKITADKFKSPLTLPNYHQIIMATIPQATVKIQADEATFTPPKSGSEEPAPIVLKKIDGAWKVSDPGAGYRDPAEMASFENIAQIYQNVADDVEQDKYKSLADVQAALAERLPKPETPGAAPAVASPAAPATQPSTLPSPN